MFSHHLKPPPHPLNQTQCGILLHKFNLAFWRSPSYNFIRLLVTVLVSLLYGTMYYQRGMLSNPATVGNIQNVVGIMFSR